MPALWRSPTPVSFVDEDNRRLAELPTADLVPRVGENVRLAGVPYVVDRVGYDLPADEIVRVWVVCRRV